MRKVLATINSKRCAFVIVQSKDCSGNGDNPLVDVQRVSDRNKFIVVALLLLRRRSSFPHGVAHGYRERCKKLEKRKSPVAI